MSLQQIIPRDMLSSGALIGVAVSGGADSVFLLHALAELGRAACVLHVNHKLRGAESDADEAFVRALAARLNLPIAVAEIPVAAGNVEQEARRARYDFFTQQIAAGFCDAVATGHTLDDQAETIFSRFLRGAGTAGLSGIRPTNRNGVIRPMLHLRRAEIRASLTERGTEWRNDSSNLDTSFERNRIRLELMPQLGPALPEILASTAEWARGEEDYWTAEIARLAPPLLQQNGEVILIHMKALLAHPVAVQRRLLRRAIEILRGGLRSIDFRHIEAIRALTHSLEGSGRLQLPDLDIFRSFDWLRFAPLGFDSRLERDFEVELTIPGKVTIPERNLFMELELTTGADVYNKQENVLDWWRCAGSLTLRNWRPGDSLRLSGKSGAEKIKSLFQEYRIPLWERRSWPVIAEGSSIVWTRQFGPAAEFAAGPDSGQVLLIREDRESNGRFQTSNDVTGISGSVKEGL
jgi:tRNA(Ile)-lysidine synthase